MDRLNNYFRSGMQRIFSGMMLSRLSGLGRDLAMAYAFGDHPMVAAFIVAFRLANIFRRFFGEGPLQSAFIPQFEELKEKDPEQAYKFFQKLTFIIGGLVCVIIVIGETGIWISFHLWSVESQEILRLIKWMLPSLFFISLYGLNVCFLQCHNRFFIPNVAPVLCNGLWIVGALTSKDIPLDQAMLGVAKCVAVGFIMQWMLTFFQMLRQMGTQKWEVRDLVNPEVKKLAKTAGLGMLGVGSSQLNAFFDVIFARWSHVSAPAYLWYATRFQQLALALFGISALSTLVPILSRAIKSNNTRFAREIFSFGSRRMLLMILPITFGMCVLGFAAIHFIFGRGHFTLSAVAETAKCLRAYSIGILPSTLVLYDSAIFYAEGNFKTPALFSTLAIIFHLLLNAFFIFVLGFGPISTALSTSISAWGNCLALRSVLNSKGWRVGLQWKETFLVIAALLVATLFTHQISALFSDRIYQLFIPAAVFVTFLGLYGTFFRKSLFNDSPSKAPVSLIKDY